MNNWVITECGKVIELDKINGMLWRQYEHSLGKKLEKERISDYKLNIKKFNTKTPTIKKVEEAILSQYPKIILTNKEQKDWYLLENINYEEKYIEVEKEEFNLKIQSGSWQEVIINKEEIKIMHNQAKQLKQGKYKKGNSTVSPITDDIFMLKFTGIWLVLFRIKKFKNDYKIYSCILRNLKNLKESVFESTYGRDKITKELHFTELSNSKSNSLNVSKLKIKKGWLEIGVLRGLRYNFFETCEKEKVLYKKRKI